MVQRPLPPFPSLFLTLDLTLGLPPTRVIKIPFLNTSDRGWVEGKIKSAIQGMPPILKTWLPHVVVILLVALPSCQLPRRGKLLQVSSMLAKVLEKLLHEAELPATKASIMSPKGRIEGWVLTGPLSVFCDTIRTTVEKRVSRIVCQ